MKQNVYLPLKMINYLTKLYPVIWKEMEEFHNMNGTSSYANWPDWCYAPIEAALTIASDGNNLNILTPKQKGAVVSCAQLISVLAPWRLSKEVYIIDEKIKDLLFEQKDDVEIPTDILLHLPYQCFYIELPNTYFDSEKIHGFFVSLDYNIKLKERDLKLTFLSEKEDVFSYPIDLDAGSIEKSIKKLNDQLVAYAKGDKELEEYAKSDPAKDSETITFIKQVMQIVLYILAQNAEIAPDEEQKAITKRGVIIKDKYSEIRKWDVGFRTGSAIRLYEETEKLRSTENQNKNGSHASPRPHMRRGHWHHFWTGPKAQPEERKLILKWLSPMTVATNTDDTPVVIHKVEL